MDHSDERVSAAGSDTGLTRREMNAGLLGSAALAAVAGLVGPVARVMGQPGLGTRTPPRPAPVKPSTPGPGGKSFLSGVFRTGTTNDWTLRTAIHLDSYESVSTTAPTTGRPGAGTPGPAPGPVTIIPFDFVTAAVVFPAITTTAASEATPTAVTAVLKMDGKKFLSEPTWIEGMPAGARYGRWDMKDLKGRTIDFDVEMRTKTWELKFDDAAASKAIWPKSGHWPEPARSALGSQAGVDPNDPEVRAILNTWCSNKPPSGIPPVQLAKFLAARVLEEIQPSGDGLVSSKTGLLQGFFLKPHSTVLKDKRGSEHDIACLLCALYRAADLPARIVIGFDVTQSNGQSAGLGRQGEGAIRSWVEFCLVDETVLTVDRTPTLIWVPVDVMRQRKSSNKAPPLERSWPFFGNNADTAEVIPIAFDYHPPLSGVIAHGSPALWGWMTTPEMQTATQSIRFLAMKPSKTAPSRDGGGLGTK